jgi:hypothetical protein
MIMLAYVLSLGLLLQNPAQPCHKVDVVHTAAQKQALKQFIAECHQQGLIFQGKGIIKMTVYQDAEGQPNWWLSAMEDDQYKDNPTLTYSKFAGELILVYQGDSTPQLTDKAQVNSCLEAIINNRVKRRPEAQYVEEPGPNGTTRKTRVMTMKGGGLGNDTHFTFKPDGTYTALRGA